MRKLILCEACGNEAIVRFGKHPLCRACGHEVSELCPISDSLKTFDAVMLGAPVTDPYADAIELVRSELHPVWASRVAWLSK